MRMLGRIIAFLVGTLGRVAYFVFAAVGFVVVAVIGLLAFAGASAVGTVSERIAAGVVDVPETVVLTADWRGGVFEKQRGLGAVPGLPVEGGAGLPDVLLALERAATDERVRGLVVRVDGSGFGLARAWELRDAVERLNAAGKFTALYADTLGELEGGMVGTYLAAAFEHVQLQPLGTLGFTGLASDRLYFGRLLDAQQIGVQVIKREDYKSALEPFARSGPSPESEAVTDRLFDGLFATFVDGVAEARGLDVPTVRRLVDRGPLLGEEAVAAGLVDAIGHEAELWSTVEARTETDERLELDAYIASDVAAEGDAERVVGFVHAVGPIRRGENADFGSDSDIAGDTAAAAIDAARAAEVDALLLRVSSPGGSAVASETVAAAIRRAKDVNIPVVVSMGDVAASGGYWISMDADRIFAAPTTITGSIGVIAGKPALEAFLADLGIDVAMERRGANAGFGSVIEPWDANASARLNALIDELYEGFLNGVATGRGMDVAAVREVAGGQVWLGDQALENGLVDELGGFLAAYAAAREAAGAGPDEPVALARFPEPSPPFLLALRGLERIIEAMAVVDTWWRAVTAPPALRLEASGLPQPR